MSEIISPAQAVQEAKSMLFPRSDSGQTRSLYEADAGYWNKMYQLYQEWVDGEENEEEDGEESEGKNQQLKWKNFPLPEIASDQAPRIVTKEQLLSAGGEATIRLGWDTKLKKLVAVKTYTESAPWHLTRADQWFKLLAEARALALLHHPNLIRVEEVVIDGTGNIHYIMPAIYAEKGMPADLWLRDFKANMTPQAFMGILQDLANVTDFLVRSGVTHFDIKPSNILILHTPDRPRAILADLGTAKQVATSQLLHGTREYMAPERKDSSHFHATRFDVEAHKREELSAAELNTRAVHRDLRSEVYSVAITALEILTGSRELKETNIAEVVQNWKIAEHSPARRLASTIFGRSQKLASYQEEISHKLFAIFQKALAERPKDRYSSSEEFAAAIKSLLPKKIIAPQAASVI